MLQLLIYIQIQANFAQYKFNSFYIILIIAVGNIMTFTIVLQNSLLSYFSVQKGSNVKGE